MDEKFKAFEIDDSFDPLAKMKIEEEGPDTDYLPPEDFESLVVAGSKDEALSPEERIEALLKGMPGQRARIVGALGFCQEARTFDEIDEYFSREWSHDVSVYAPSRLMLLLEEAGMLDVERTEPCDPEVDDDGCLSAKRPEPDVYTTSAAGIAFLSAEKDFSAMKSLIAEDDGRYLPLYREIFSLIDAEGGKSVSEINAVVDLNPLCAEPRRFATYFLRRLESAGAIVWKGNWMMTEDGRAAFESGLFGGKEA